MTMFLFVLLSAALLSLAGCGGSSSPTDCGPVGLNVTPASMTVDHTALPPANSQTFSASFQFSNKPGCPAVTAALVSSNWTVSDPSVHLSTMPASQISATCTAAVANPVTITATAATGQAFTGQASLSCK